jgi:hypothetical protein
MFKNTNDFFQEVLNFTIAQIDIENYIEQITDNHSTDKLITLRQDLYYFAEDFVNDYYDNHSSEQLLEQWTKELSQDIKLKNNLYALITDAENNNAIIKNADFHFEYFKFKTKDIKTHIIWLLLKPINMLVEYLNELIDKSVISIESTPTHNNIFSNNFDNVNEDKVYYYFKTELVDKKYLKETDLLIFLDLAFNKKTIPKDKISFIEFRTKQTIIQIFYKYYKNISFGKQGGQRKYIKLLTDYFEGFEFETIKTNFSK